MNMLRKIFLFGSLSVACMAFGQNFNTDRVDRPNTKKINFGIKAGFNSSMFMVSGLMSTNTGTAPRSTKASAVETIKSVISEPFLCASI